MGKTGREFELGNETHSQIFADGDAFAEDVDDLYTFGRQCANILHWRFFSSAEHTTSCV